MGALYGRRAMRSSQLAVTTLLIKKGEGGPVRPVSFKGMLQRGFTEPDSRKYGVSRKASG